MKKVRKELLLLIKYGCVGILNTLLTWMVFYLLSLLSINIDLANFLSYAVGILNSFAFNKIWVFKSQKERWKKEAVLFLSGALICWFLQWVAFRSFLLFMNKNYAFWLGMMVYPVLNFLYNRWITFNEGKKNAAC